MSFIQKLKQKKHNSNYTFFRNARLIVIVNVRLINVFSKVSVKREKKPIKFSKCTMITKVSSMKK